MKRCLKTKLHNGLIAGRRILLSVLALFCLMIACSPEAGLPEQTEEPEETGLRLYYMNDERTKVVSEPYLVEGYALNTKIANMLTALEEVLWTQEELDLLAEKNPIVGFEVKADELLAL